MHKVIIRQAKLVDLKQMKRLNESSLQENYSIQYWISVFKESPKHSFVAINGGQVIGYILGNTNSIVSFATEQKFRSKGIGTQLLYHCLNTYKVDVSLHVRVTNEVAKKLYYSSGFKDHELIKDYYNNPTVDALHLILQYEPSRSVFPTDHKLHIHLDKSSNDQNQ